MEHPELIKACKRNDYNAQMRVYELYKDMLYATSLRILKNEFDAQDVVHDGFIKGFQNINKLGDHVNLGGWLKRIVINCSLDFLRNKKKVQWLEDSEMLGDISIVQEIPLDVEEISIENIKKAIDSLKDKYRIIVVLYLIENYTHKEIAQQLGLNESTVRNQYIRGKDQLKKQLEKKILS